MQIILMDSKRAVSEDCIVTQRVLPLRFRLIMAGVAITFSLGIAELLVSFARSGAFPYLNLFQRHERYGVVLEPGAKARTVSRGGRVTEIRTNALGFRGPEWKVGHQGRARVLLLGDSQMFGYGVAERDALAGQLETAGFDVLNASVPSWGPIEYALAVEDLAPWFRPDVVLFVANVANDWPEANVANTKRSSARDGWLTRHAEAAPLNFPLRRQLLGKSHLIFTAREVRFGLKGISIAEARAGKPPADAARLLVGQFEQLAVPSGEYRSRVTPHLIRAQNSAGVPVIAVALPMDVQTHPTEWKKYAGAPIDLRAADILLDDFLADAAARNIPALDLRPILKAASPGAFLDDDYHLSEKGHQAIAAALVPVLNYQARTLAARGAP